MKRSREEVEGTNEDGVPNKIQKKTENEEKVEEGNSDSPQSPLSPVSPTLSSKPKLSAAEKNEERRRKSRKSFASKLGGGEKGEKLAEELENAVYKLLGENKDLSKEYRSKVIQLAAALRNNEELRQLILTQKISIEKLPTMSQEELLTKKEKEYRKRLEHEMLGEHRHTEESTFASDQYPCEQCGAKDSVCQLLHGFVNKSIHVKCNKCGHYWTA